MILGFMDPYVLAFPPTSKGGEAVVSYVKKLIDWGEIKDQPWFTMLLPAATCEALALTNGFPPWERVQQSLNLSDIGIQAEDVISVMNSILMKSTTVEEMLEVKDILLDEVVCSPDYYGDREGRHKEEYERLLGMISLFPAEKNISPNRRRLITGDAPCPHTVNFKAALLEVVYSDPLKTSPNLPSVIDDNVIGVCCIEVAWGSADCLALWEIAVTKDEFRAVINLYMCQNQPKHSPIAASWTIGGKFVASILGANLTNRTAGAKILRACQETIQALDMASVHALRKTDAGGSGQKMRGKDGAFRRDIDYELHLHYWACPSGPELACVVLHNNFAIPE